MLARLILLFVTVPLADLALLMLLSQYIGLWTSVGLVVLSGIIGAFLAQQSWRSVMQKMQTNLSRGKMSSELLSDSAMVLFAAGLLLTPGFLTDAAGLSLLIPQCRKVYRTWVTAWLKRNFKFQIVSMNPGQSAHDPNTVDGEVVRNHDDSQTESEIPETNRTIEGFKKIP